MSEVRVVRIDGKLSVNLSYEQLSTADIDIMVGATKDSIVMVEGEMKEISEQEMLEAIKFAHEEIKIQIEAQERLAAKVGKAFLKENTATKITMKKFVRKFGKSATTKYMK